MRHLVLVGTVVIHDPDFFVSAAVADKINLALRDPLHLRPGEDDFISELVRGRTGGVAGRGIGVLLAQHLR